MKRSLSKRNDPTSLSYKSILKNRLPLLALWPVALLLPVIAKTNPAAVEEIYSRVIYPIISTIVGFIPSLLPFSLAEFLIYSLVISAAVLIVYMLISLIRRGRLKRVTALILTLLAVSGNVYFSFYAFWGLNYYRQPLAVSTGYDLSPASKEDLVALCRELIADANPLRETLSEDDTGIFKPSRSDAEYAKMAPQFLEGVLDKYEIPYGRLTAPKRVVYSSGLSALGISGIFFPFTIEANVNTNMPKMFFPSSILHETAHMSGFAREDEANFLSYLACVSSGDKEFMYSGTLMALTYSMNELYKIDRDAYSTLYDTYCDGIVRDLQHNNRYWKSFDSEIKEASANVNDAYLKRNDQADGIKSYSNMVQLLIAERKSN